MTRLSVIVPAHNPHPGRLARTLDALRGQTLPADRWELVIVDNRSDRPLREPAGLAWPPNGRVVREDRIGLTNARLRGFAESAGEGVVMVDDDNVLAPDYLERAVRLFETRPRVGVFGGRNDAEFESPPSGWFEEIHGPLAIESHGDVERVASWDGRNGRDYPPFAPVGAGMCLRRAVAVEWAGAVAADPVRRSLDRSGASLASGGDNDIVMTALGLGWEVGYFPGLRLTHLIPAGRLTPEYHARLLESSGRSWVVTLGLHGIRPWPPLRPWTLPARRLRAAVRFRPWSGTAGYLRWRSACGNLAGRADLWTIARQRDAVRPAAERRGIAEAAS